MDMASTDSMRKVDLRADGLLGLMLAGGVGHWTGSLVAARCLMSLSCLTRRANRDMFEEEGAGAEYRSLATEMLE